MCRTPADAQTATNISANNALNRGLTQPLGAPPPCDRDVALLPGIFSGEKSRKVGEKFGEWEKSCKFAMQIATGVLAHLVERNTGSVEVSGSSPLCSTK